MQRHALTALAALLLVVVLLTPAAQAATRTTVELNVNKDTIEGRLQLQYPLRANTVNVAYDGIYKEDEYRIAGVEFFLGNTLSRDLECFLGFRGVYGEFTALPREPKLSSVGFSGKSRYTLIRDLLAFPVVWVAQLTVSPEPMSFDDTEKYWSLRTSLDFNVLQDSGITVGYRYREADLEKRGLNRSYEEGSAFIGYKLTF
jgi:hypothetical protein